MINNARMGEEVVMDEKLKWCDFCGYGRDKQWADDWAIIDQTHTERLVTILFCPMCGRQLTEGLEVANEI